MPYIKQIKKGGKVKYIKRFLQFLLSTFYTKWAIDNELGKGNQMRGLSFIIFVYERKKRPQPLKNAKGRLAAI